MDSTTIHFYTLRSEKSKKKQIRFKNVLLYAAKKGDTDDLHRAYHHPVWLVPAIWYCVFEMRYSLCNLWLEINQMRRGVRVKIHLSKTMILKAIIHKITMLKAVH
jgi:hypothetical protein